MQDNKKNSIIVYTDGGCHGNPGPGAWSYYIQTCSRNLAIANSEKDTTNNRMELKAAISALSFILSNNNWNDKHIVLYSDSMYLINGITKWIHNWKKHDWFLKSNKKSDVKNSDLWKSLDNLNSNLDVEWKWIKGHNGNKYNEFCDKLCQDKISEIQ